MKRTMQLSELLGIRSNLAASGISFDSARVKRGDLFFALKDEAREAREAEERGAVCVISGTRVPVNVLQVKVENIRKTFALVSKRFFGNAADKLTICAITGTNGKTTTSFMTDAILSYAGLKAAVIGTNGTFFGEKRYDSTLTTPDPNELHALLSELYDDGARYVTLEASAHALALEKLSGIRFKTACFTSLSRDHLDFFETFQRYFDAKKRLFAQADNAVINVDDEHGASLAASLGGALTCSITAASELKAESVERTANGVEAVVSYRGERARATVPLIGGFNAYNALCAIGNAITLGVPFKTAAEGIATVKEIDGRMNVIRAGGATVIVDFAHTDDGLKKVLSAAREITRSRLICAFGCGGNRDEGKREKMGEAAAELCDEIILTSDNPRFEDPLKIISQIETGIKNRGYVQYSIVPDRKEAIRLAVGKLRRGDVLVVAGKGAERYQEINGERLPHDDKAFVKELLGADN